MTKATPIPSNKITKNKNTIIYQTRKTKKQELRNNNISRVYFNCLFHPVCKSSLQSTSGIIESNLLLENVQDIVLICASLSLVCDLYRCTFSLIILIDCS